MLSYCKKKSALLFFYEESFWRCWMMGHSCIWLIKCVWKHIWLKTWSLKSVPAWSFRHRNDIIEILQECWISGQGHLINSGKAECASGNHFGQRIRQTRPLSLASLLNRYVTSAMPLHFLVLIFFERHDNHTFLYFIFMLATLKKTLLRGSRTLPRI